MKEHRSLEATRYERIQRAAERRRAARLRLSRVFGEQVRDGVSEFASPDDWDKMAYAIRMDDADEALGALKRVMMRWAENQINGNRD